MYAIEDELTQRDINGLISLFCHFYEHHETFDYSDEVIELDLCDLQILSNGVTYSNEELIVEGGIFYVAITDETYPNQNYILGINYYSYDPDMDEELPVLKHKYIPLEVNDGEAEININDGDVVYIKLENWELITKFDKPLITAVSS